MMKTCVTKRLRLFMKCAEFSWDEVKADKHMETYLGHSVKAPVGRWQKGSSFSLISSFSCFFDFNLSF